MIIQGKHSFRNIEGCTPSFFSAAANIINFNQGQGCRAQSERKSSTSGAAENVPPPLFCISSPIHSRHMPQALTGIGIGASPLKVNRVQQQSGNSKNKHNGTTKASKCQLLLLLQHRQNPHTIPSPLATTSKHLLSRSLPRLPQLSPRGMRDPQSLVSP